MYWAQDKKQAGKKIDNNKRKKATNFLFKSASVFEEETHHHLMILPQTPNFQSPGQKPASVLRMETPLHNLS